MQCPLCQFDNPEGMKFCGKCGGKLERSCPKCRFKNPLEFRFCGRCGHPLTASVKSPPMDYRQPQSYTPKHLADKILTGRYAIQGERKLVTVLFADVAGFTRLSEHLDPEEVHRIMDGCFKILMDAIHRYEGTVNQFTGDGIMALFGAPVAHEDHAQRACRAALRIQSALKAYGDEVKREYGVAFRMRIGINSGAVVVGAIGDDLRMDYTAVGDTTNLAARIQQTAREGEVWVSGNTHNIISGFFQVESAGRQELKGKAEPQPAYRLIAEHKEIRTRFEAGLSKGITALVGRQSEMESLKAAWEQAKNGEARIIDVVGEAGVGKSRLAYEFLKTIAEEAIILTGVCLQYGKNMNFMPLIQIVRTVFHIEEDMTAKAAEKRIKEKTGADLEKMIPFYSNLLSLEVEDPKFNALNPEGRKFGTFEAVKELLVAVLEEGPLTIFLEDAHWLDRISEEFFGFFSRSIHGRKIFMLTAYRPECKPEWTKGPHYRHLGLEAFSENFSERLLRNILGGVKMEPALEKEIVNKSGGNPFFLEEIVRELMDRKALIRKGNQYISRSPSIRLEIPRTVHGVLLSRMDRLNEDLKRTMQVASVIGRDFAYKILHNIMELRDNLRTHLSNLVEMEVLYEKRLYPELKYIFKHALIQQVAYESLLKQRRKAIHGRIAQAIEKLYAGRLEQHYELLAHHWELSHDPHRSIEYLVLSGEKSNRIQAASSAVDFFTRALNQTKISEKPVRPELLMRIRSGRANPLSSMGKIEESVEDFQEAMRIGRELGEQKKVLNCLAQLPFLLYNTALKDEVPGLCDEGLSLARTLQDKSAEARIAASYAYWRYLWKHTPEYETFLEALKLAKESADPSAIFFISLMLSLQERWRGNPRQSLRYSEGMVERLQSASMIHLASAVSITRGWALTDLGEYNEAIAFQKKWINILERNSIYLILGRVYNGLGWTYSEVYELEQAAFFNNRAIQIAVALQKMPALIYTTAEILAMSEVNLMENKFEMGMIDEAWDRIMQFEKISADPAYDLNRERWQTRMNELKGNILLHRGDTDGAEELGKKCLYRVSKRGFKKYIGRAERLLGRVLLQKKAYEQAEAKFKSALATLEKVENPKQRWITHADLARLYERKQRPDLKRQQWQAAARLVEFTGDSLKENKIRRTFLGAMPTREIVKQASRS